MDMLHDRVKKLFHECHQNKGKVDKADDVFKEIQAEYYKTLEDADEKVQLTNQIYDLVDRHLRKLDQELAKFKMELEADNAGITEVLERKSLELDNPSSNLVHTSHNHQKRRHAGPIATITSATSSQPITNGSLEKKIKTEYVSNAGMIRSESLPANMNLNNKENYQGYGFESDGSSSRPPSRNSISSGSHTASAATTISGLHRAAVQAVQATAQMQGGRRTASMKASYEALKNIDFPTKMENAEEELDVSDSRIDVMSDDIAGSDNSVTSPSSLNISRPSRTKKPTSRAAQWTQERMQAEARRGQRDRDHHSESADPLNESANSEWACDPNEPRYCLCNQVSYGEMVGCDNEKCTIEWFHYGCVGLTEAPKGKWYCPQCLLSMKRRNKVKS